MIMAEWISVYEQLPTMRQKVIVTDGEHTWDVGEYQGLSSLGKAIDVTFWRWKKNTIKRVLWWMPKAGALPEVPVIVK